MFFRETRGLGSFILIAAPLLISASVTESAATLQFQQENNTNLLAEDACGSSPCWRGTCFGNGTDYQCFCPSGFTGKNCETTLDVCSTNPCVRGACLHYHEAYYCVCPSGYTGKNCESIINACNSDPCVRGVCYHHQTQFHCDCPTGYYGKRCEIENNECFSRPCLNGGLCVDAVGNYSCNCVQGFTGDNCQTELDECSSNPCLHGGVCKDGINRFTCQCPTGYTGDRCQNVTDPCRYNTCIRGTCFARLSQFICECPPGYTGKLCDTTRSSVYHKSSTTIGDAGTYVCNASYRSEPSVLKVFHVNITWHSETCDFDSGSLCGWSSPRSSWNQQYGKHNDHTLGTTNGRYMAIDTTSQTSDKTALLTSHDLPANHTVCFEFWYRISGSGYGKLSSMLKDTCLKKETELFQSIGDQGVKWNKVEVTVLHSLIPNDYTIILKADIRRSFIGTMAVDDLKISDGHCQGNQGLSLVG